MEFDIGKTVRNMRRLGEVAMGSGKQERGKCGVGL